MCVCLHRSTVTITTTARKHEDNANAMYLVWKWAKSSLFHNTLLFWTFSYFRSRFGCNYYKHACRRHSYSVASDLADIWLVHGGFGEMCNSNTEWWGIVFCRNHVQRIIGQTRFTMIDERRRDEMKKTSFINKYKCSVFVYKQHNRESIWA